MLWFLSCLAVSSPASAQDLIAIAGVVTTRADGLPVPAAVVSVVGSDASATTDASGRYALQVPRSAVRDRRLRVKVDALDLPPTLTDVVVDGASLALTLR